MSSSSTINQLISLYQTKACHYCSRVTNRIENHALQATRDHILPRSFGGPDDLSNYVLACRTCNNKRGTILFYCDCKGCKTTIYESLDDPFIIKHIFKGIFDANKVKVYKDHNVKDFVWTARKGSVHRRFHTFEQARKYAITGEFTKGK